MPKYAFECPNCTLIFDRNMSMSNPQAHTCPSCGAEAPRRFEGQSFGHSFAEPVGKPLANTGVHDHDYPTADKAVGRSAEKRWERYRARDKVKEQARTESGSTALIRHDEADGSISYEPMTKSGLETIHKPHAKRLIRTFDAVREAAKQAGRRQ